MPSNPRVLFILRCTHLIEAPVNCPKRMRCVMCGTDQDITGVHEYEWRAFCERDGCRFSRWTGLSRDNARVWGMKHARANPGHGKDVVVEYTPNPGAEKARKILERHAIGLHHPEMRASRNRTIPGQDTGGKERGSSL